MNLYGNYIYFRLDKLRDLPSPSTRVFSVADKICKNVFFWIEGWSLQYTQTSQINNLQKGCQTIKPKLFKLKK